jgi:hypothetical protein
MLRYRKQYVDQGMKYYGEKYREHEITTFITKPGTSASRFLTNTTAG